MFSPNALRDIIFNDDIESDCEQFREDSNTFEGNALHEGETISPLSNKLSTCSAFLCLINDLTAIRFYSFEVPVRIKVSIDEYPVLQILHDLQYILKNCECTIPRCEIGKCSQAAYEDQTVEVRAQVVLTKKSGVTYEECLVEFVRNFTTMSGFGLSGQPLLQIENLLNIFSSMKAVHDSVDIVCLTLGNMPNCGLFFIRGEYISRYNCTSNVRVSKTFKESRVNSAAGFAGHNKLLSWATFEHDRCLLTIYFAIEIDEPLEDGLLCRGYKLVLSYESFHSIIVYSGKDHPEKDNHVFIQVRHPPQLWEAYPRTSPDGRRTLNLTLCHDWVRTSSWPGNKYFVGCSKETLARSSFVSFSMPKETIKPKDMFPDELINWQQRSTALNLAPTALLFDIVARLARRAKCPIYFAAVMRVIKPEPQLETPIVLPSFRANYAFEALLCRGSRVTDQLLGAGGTTNNHFLKRIIDASQECLEACEETLESMLKVIDERKALCLLSFFAIVYQQRLAIHRNIIVNTLVPEKNDLPTNCVALRKVLITPLQTLLLTPEVTMTNRILRRFDKEFALRVVFRDDNNVKLLPNEFAKGKLVQGRSNFVQSLIFRTLSEGIRIESRHYRFLAWSNSQMRDHGCYMYCKAEIFDPERGIVREYTVDDIRHWMGDFATCKSVPKLMSRMGQCFTQAQPTIELKPNEWRVDDDIINHMKNLETGEYGVFSDGIGRISMNFSTKVASSLQLRSIPSCFQVRFKGFKGVLSVDPVLDLENRQHVVFRKSQKKFDDGNISSELEVVKYSMPTLVCLNRPLIMILDQVSMKQGLEYHKRVCSRIYSLLAEELNALTEMLVNESAALANLSSRITLPINFYQLHASGVTFTNEPFFRSLLSAIHRYVLQQNLIKAKIFLPESMGRTMYGVLDETGLLQYGQVFVQYSEHIGENQVKQGVILHLGPVMVSKNPCHAPGDVRMFEAVYQPSLAHLKDVIVFPRYGPRPHPDEMAGSDLDGDEYLVFFDKNLFLKTNEEPMTFPKCQASPIEDEEAITDEDMINFFLNFLMQDSIGRMSNAHLITADRWGIFSDICNRIAEKCATAVDFPKTGIPAPQLEFPEFSDIVPDYMQNTFKPSYWSNRLLGSLFRKTKACKDIVDLVGYTQIDFPPDPQLYDETLFNTESSLISDAVKMYNEYCFRIRHFFKKKLFQQLMQEYGVTDEASIVSGYCVTLRRINEMEKDDYTFYSTDKIIQMRFARIFEIFRTRFFEEFGGKPSFSLIHQTDHSQIQMDLAIIKKAVAWYSVCYHRHAKFVTDFRSFPWVVWDVLLLVKQNQTTCSSGIRTRNPFLSHLNKNIEAYCEDKKDEIRSLVNDLSGKVDSGQKCLKSFVQLHEKYGESIDKLCFILDNWLQGENVYEKSRIRRFHAFVLLFQFCIGIRHENKSLVKNTNHRHYLSYQEVGPVLHSEKHLLELNIGEILFDFIKYLASEGFARSEKIHFRLENMLDADKKPHDCAPVFFRPQQWALLHNVAYRTFNHIAVSLNFEALHLIRPDALSRAWDFGESETPLIISLSSFKPSIIRFPKIVRCLKKWSGVKSLTYRTISRDIALMSFSGTVIARQKLERIIHLGPEQLIEAVTTGFLPREMQDNFTI